LITRQSSINLLYYPHCRTKNSVCHHLIIVYKKEKFQATFLLILDTVFNIQVHSLDLILILGPWILVSVVIRRIHYCTETFFHPPSFSSPEFFFPRVFHPPSFSSPEFLVIYVMEPDRISEFKKTLGNSGAKGTTVWPAAA